MTECVLEMHGVVFNTNRFTLFDTTTFKRISLG